MRSDRSIQSVSQVLPMASHQTPNYQPLFQPYQYLPQRHAGGSMVAAQMQRNGQLKYQRTRVAADRKQVEMPDGEVVSQFDK